MFCTGMHVFSKRLQKPKLCNFEAEKNRPAILHLVYKCANNLTQGREIVQYEAYYTQN